MDHYMKLRGEIPLLRLLQLRVAPRATIHELFERPEVVGLRRASNGGLTQ